MIFRKNISDITKKLNSFLKRRDIIQKFKNLLQLIYFAILISPCTSLSSTHSHILRIGSFPFAPHQEFQYVCSNSNISPLLHSIVHQNGDDDDDDEGESREDYAFPFSANNTRRTPLFVLAAVGRSFVHFSSFSILGFCTIVRPLHFSACCFVLSACHAIILRVRCSYIHSTSSDVERRTFSYEILLWSRFLPSSVQLRCADCSE